MVHNQFVSTVFPGQEESDIFGAYSSGRKSMDYKAVNLSASLIEKAMKDAEATSFSLPEQVEYYYQLGVIAEQYPDLPISMIKSLMESTKEEANLEFVLD
jgi:hypothetical protein